MSLFQKQFVNRTVVKYTCTHFVSARCIQVLAEQKERHHWKIPENRKLFFDYLGKKLNIQNLDDWYSTQQLFNCIWYGVKTQDIRENGGQSLTSMFDNWSDALMEAFKEHQWKVGILNS